MYAQGCHLKYFKYTMILYKLILIYHANELTIQPYDSFEKDSPLSKYRTVEFLEKLGSKFAMSGAIYWVAVSMRCVISPVKIKPIQILGDKGKKQVYFSLLKLNISVNWNQNNISVTKFQVRKKEAELVNVKQTF